MARDRDVAAFGERAQGYDEGWRGRMHHQIADRTRGQGTYQTAGSPFADGGGIALTTVAPPGRRHHPGGHGDEIAAAIITRALVPMGAG